MKQLDAGELPLNKILSSDYDFVIPDYQRPYAWTHEHALQLLDDLEDALNRTDDEPYFLGSIVLVKVKGEARAEVIDGQQRLTTTTILLAVLRDLTSNAQLATELGHHIQEPGSIMAGNQPKPRLLLRKREAYFFRIHVQEAGNIGDLVAGAHDLETDAQVAIRKNAAALHEKLSGWTEDKRQRLAMLIGSRTFVVVVSTPDLASAHRIFSVMNARGLNLSPADIFKARVIGAIAEAKQAAYSDKWEDEEVDLGREGFAELFLHIRMIFAKVRAQRELLIEFPQDVLNAFLPDRAQEFVDDELVPYSNAYEHILKQNYQHGPGSDKVNAWLQRLVQLDNNDWRPPALWALRHHADAPAWLDQFFRRLERLAASMLLRRVYATPRAMRYAELLKQLERGDGHDAGAFNLEPDERKKTVEALEGDLYLVQPVRKYVLLRLDELIADSPGVSYQHKIITVEHVLPQHPKSGSQWESWFTTDEREFWTHKLANLVLLNRAKNSAAQNYDLATKRSTYFSAVFALTAPVLAVDEWTPSFLAQRQAELLKRLTTEWELS